MRRELFAFRRTPASALGLTCACVCLIARVRAHAHAHEHAHMCVCACACAHPRGALTFARGSEHCAHVIWCLLRAFMRLVYVLACMFRDAVQASWAAPRMQAATSRILQQQVVVASGIIIIITCAIAHPRETTSKATAGYHVVCCMTRTLLDAITTRTEGPIRSGSAHQGGMVADSARHSYAGSLYVQL